MNDEELRQWCLERALTYFQSFGALGGTVLEMADNYYQYVKTGPLTKEPVKQAA